ncbi:NAD(P)-dependent oxidoreductase [Motilimonas sp. E26]|uniref:NAD-dependent epimerase/dehydratase family protein n=1 Tax=Motilimonas sp. E26 TaxID=2865674 RepID=UPI001E52C59A|nr:NAD(P)-dependent oxidoreductase [Motilimonas sp. E26]MCE0558577.1 NAD(P)-dependent oxidoreductase [Motilimonas sp. E26]
MNILITGGLGNLGSWLMRECLDNHSVTVLARKERHVVNHPNYRFVQADITQQEQLNFAIDCYYDVCIHTASYNEHFQANYTKDALMINSLGTELLCQALARHGVGQLVYFSTFHVYGKTSGVVEESTSITPFNDYGLTHYFAEKYIEKHHRQSGLNYVILRLSNSYGCPTFKDSDKWYLVLNDICNQAFSQQKIQLKSNGLAIRDFIWMGDVVDVVIKLLYLSQPLNDTFNLSAGISYSLNQMVDRVQLAYRQEFGGEVAIIANKQDKTEPAELLVSNKKLCAVITHQYRDGIVQEAKKIFQLLAR